MFIFPFWLFQDYDSSTEEDGDIKYEYSFTKGEIIRAEYQERSYKANGIWYKIWKQHLSFGKSIDTFNHLTCTFKGLDVHIKEAETYTCLIVKEKKQELEWFIDTEDERSKLPPEIQDMLNEILYFHQKYWKEQDKIEQIKNEKEKEEALDSVINKLNSPRKNQIINKNFHFPELPLFSFFLWLAGLIVTFSVSFSLAIYFSSYYILPLGILMYSIIMLLNFVRQI